MTDRVPADVIEIIVEHPRHQYRHFGRAVSSEKRFYILHSHLCLDTFSDLRDCPFSLALDAGVDFPVEDETYELRVTNNRLTTFGVAL